MNVDQWWLRRHVGNPGPEHAEEQCDHRHFLAELNVGWVWRTAAGRLETVTRIEPVDRYEYWWRIWTDLTGPDYSWRRRKDDRVDAIPRSWDRAPHLRFVDLPGSRHTRSSMSIVPAPPNQTIPDFNQALCTAVHLGQGEGWKVTDRPDGGDEVITACDTKAKARTALIAAGRHHAKMLGLTLYRENPHA